MGTNKNNIWFDGFFSPFSADRPNRVVATNAQGFSQASDVTSSQLQASISTLNTYKVDNIAALRLQVGVSHAKADTLGYYSVGDGGNNSFYWDSASVLADNGGTIIQATGTSVGRWIAINTDTVNVKQFGAKGDGVFNNDSVFTLVASLGVKAIVPIGQYLTTLPTTFSWINFSGDGIVSINGFSFNLAYFTTPKKRIGELTALMNSGGTVKIACYGDSTTDGNNTTGWTANAGGNHNPTAPNTWPVKLQSTLREMYSNNNISVFNAGYTGQRLDNGWAYSNYEPAIIQNGSYGVVDLTFIAFGLNDIQDAGSQIANHMAETRKLIKKALGYGSLPVLLTCDAEWRTASSGDIRDSVEASREINAVKFDLAKEFNIPIFDVDFELRKWFELNNEPYKWYNVQTDALHVNDFGHAFKASLMAKELFRDIIPVKNELVRIFPFDSKAKYVGGQTQVFTSSNTRTGANVRLLAGQYTTGSALMTLWVWNETEDCTVIYNHIDNDENSVRSTGPSIVVKEFIEGTNIFNDKIFNSGGISNIAGSPIRYSDRKSPLCQLYYGLNKIQYIAPSVSVNTFYGFFAFIPNMIAGYKRTNAKTTYPPFVNALKNTGPIYYKAAAGSGVTFQLCEDFIDGCNLVSYGQDSKVTTLFFDADIDQGGGLILLGGKGFTGSDFKNASLLLYRKLTELRLYTLSITSANAVNFNLLATATGVSWSGLHKLRVEFKRNGSGNQQITLFDDWTGATTLLTKEVLSSDTVAVPVAGSVGGVYTNSADNAAGSLVYINNKFIQYS